MARILTSEESQGSLDPVYEPIRDDLRNVERAIRAVLGSNFPVLDKINRYIFEKPGKMLRPALVFLSARAVSGKASDGEYRTDRLVDLAVVVELLHNASLLHDDVLDRSAKRRGRPSLNASYDDRTAVLAGDVLFSKAFSTLSRSFTSEITIPITETTSAMCRGEILAAEYEGRPTTLEEYYRIIRMKTADFMGICCFAGAEAVGKLEPADALFEYGVNFGLAYQIVDDYGDGDAGNVEGFSIDLAAGHIEKAKTALQEIEEISDPEPLERFISAVFPPKVVAI